jgi:hypothetical protein
MYRAFREKEDGHQGGVETVIQAERDWTLGFRSPLPALPDAARGGRIETRAFTHEPCPRRYGI